MFSLVLDLKVDDYVGFTFFTGYMAMMAASVFFFFERGSVEGKWRLSLLVSGLITFIAAVHYYYMRDYYLETSSRSEEEFDVEDDICFCSDACRRVYWRSLYRW